MTLARLRPRLVLAVVALVATGLLVAKLVSSGSTGPARASTADPHAIPHYQAGQLRHLLAATPTGPARWSPFAATRWPRPVRRA